MAKASAKIAKKPGRRGPAKAKPVLLSGGNPQLARADGDAPVQAYLAALSGWKREVARRLDALITRAVPGVRKAVRWNSPMYGHGIERPGWFAFFRGTSLRPMPPGESKQKETRYLDLREGDDLDEARLTRWVKQASRLSGEER